MFGVGAAICSKRTQATGRPTDRRQSRPIVATECCGADRADRRGRPNNLPGALNDFDRCLAGSQEPPMTSCGSGLTHRIGASVAPKSGVIFGAFFADDISETNSGVTPMSSARFCFFFDPAFWSPISCFKIFRKSGSTSEKLIKITDKPVRRPTEPTDRVDRRRADCRACKASKTAPQNHYRCLQDAPAGGLKY